MEEYDPEWVELEKAIGKPQLPDDLHARREAFNASLIATSKHLPPTDPGIKARDIDDVPECPKLRVYRPPNGHNSNESTQKLLPCLVYVHGGGWLSGNLDTEDHMCRVLCAQTPCVVVSVEYGIFPFVRFPVPVEDCFKAYQWAWTHADELGADPSRFAICGGSAGAALAIAVVYRLIAAGQGERIAGLISLQGLFVDPSKLPEQYKGLHTSYEDNSGPLPIVSGEDMKMALHNVVGDEALNDVSQFPLHKAPDALMDFPKTYIINTEKEALRDDGTVLEAVLKQLGIEVKRDCMLSLPHYFWCFPVKNAGQKFRELLVEGARWAMSVKAS